MGIELSAVFWALSSALIWGTSDFCGGFTAKRNNVFAVIVVSQLFGLALLLFLVLGLGIGGDMPPIEGMIWGMLAGWVGVSGLAAFYHGLAHGRMGVVAPVTGIIAAAIPVAFSFVMEGIPLKHQLVGFALALVALWLVSRGDSKAPFDLNDVRAGVIAGIGFGFFFVLLDRMSDIAIWWPLIAARMASLAVMIPLVSIRQGRKIFPIRRLPLVALVGILDTLANGFYAQATRTGRLDTATVLSSLYPAITVLMAWLLLKERISGRQWIGVAIALVAVALISV